MSLNGLDDAAIKEAHDAAVAEPGGWFLLKYASRDEIGLLGRGTGGIVEIRDAIDQYEEASPLYGFLKYRRRNVIIKYLPDNCSRLVQARVAVHFNAVCEWFAPYNTTFSISEAKELKDTKLSAACSLHTASSSTSSSTSSLRRRRLVEIAEEEEEEQQRATKRQSIVKEEERAAAGLSDASSPPVTLNAHLAALPDESQFAGTTEPPSFTGLDRPSSPSQSLDGRRLSSQLTRPEMHSYATYTYGKPKVKLAPRPSLDVSGRPRTSAGTGTFRPVSSIPAGFKLFSKGSRRGRGDAKSSQIDEDENELSGLSAEDIAAIPLPADPSETLDVVRPHTSGGRPTSSSGLSVRSIANTVATQTKQDKISPEKARLMKAMKLREKKRKLGAQKAMVIPTVDISEPPAEPEASEPTPTDDRFDAASIAGASVAGSLDGELSTDNALASNADSSDSTIDVDLSSTAADQVSIDTHTTDSHPASPMVESSDIGDSTKASSLSESTDETVQALQDLKAEADMDDAGKEVVEPGTVEPEVSGAEATKTEDTNSEVTEPGATVREVVQPEAAEPVIKVATDNVTEPEVKKLTELAVCSAVENIEDRGVVQPEPVTVGAIKVGEDDSVQLSETDAQTTPTNETASGETLETEHASANVKDVDAAKDTRVKEPKEEGQSANPKAAEESVLEAIEKPMLETPNASRPNTSATIASELSSDLDHDAPSGAATIPSILVQQRDSQSTIGLETTEASSAEAKRARRRALVDPIRTDMNKDDAHLSDDDDLMEELQSASVQEAKPMLVSKSPVSSAFPGTSPSKSPRADSDRLDRTVSNPTRGTLQVPSDVTTSSARSVSSGAAYLHKIAQQNATNLSSKKSNIGSSISQRIKALEKLSGSAPGPVVDAPVRVERPTSAFFSVRKPTVRDTSRSPSVVDRASSLTREKTPSPPDSAESTPEMPRLTTRDRAGSMASRLSMFEGGNVPRGRPESVQVKARINRDPTQPFPKLGDSNYDSDDFKQSHLTVNHQKGTGMPGSVYAASASVQAATDSGGIQRKESLRERRMSREKRRSQSQDRSEAEEYEGTRPRRRSSLSIVKDFIKDRRTSTMASRSGSTDNLNNTLMSPASIANSTKSTSRPPSVHNSGLGRRLSISSRRSTSKDRDMNTTPLGTPMSPSEGNASSDDSKSVNGEYGHKKTGSGGRASRFMRRLSSSLGNNRKNATPTISPTVAEEEEVYNAIPPSRGSIAVPQNAVSYIGDVNVQFPDNLLWKRRTMCLDSQGFLILSTGGTTSSAASIISDRPAGTVKRYHLSDFRLPYIPEMELQELPNSVCLDFVEGSGLQVACEDRAGQMNILQILQEAHQSHSSYGQ
ncbi:prolipoprotein diacylglyceryl transferase [Ophiostoma piceae UAMH 11346]|uniref:Prolipoprotein diacylglyceryl transferase n=1 Tax=Ophiostoma piceae (strain UAMH 11346) TaxID=1262450 RepID=S3CQX6_OPHP1|nr:prolipoprotein diacylglyceryl transferase [Ophiostoma piceae UAMH 11346]